MNYSDWRKTNEGKSLNDYYAYLRKYSKDKFIKNTPPNNMVNNTKIKRTYLSKKNFVLIVIILLTYILNPNSERHRDSIINDIKLDVKNQSPNLDFLNNIKNVSISYIVEKTVKVNNRREFILFSICDVTVLGEKYGYSIGFFNFIYLYKTKSD